MVPVTTPEPGEMLGVLTVGVELFTPTEALFELADAPAESVTVAEQ